MTFDAKDYAAVDHGYAATFHKSQGVTVDRAHLLATPGMDRHSGYVGLSRHRDGVQLHYGCGDFADQDKLARVLSRDRGKDMASDYALDRSDQDHARTFANRREIRFLELERQVVEKVRDKARGMFDGFKPKPALADHVEAGTRRGADKAAAPVEYYQRPTREGVVKSWTAEHARELAGVQARAQRAQVRANGMYKRHEAVRGDHARTQPLPPTGLLVALRRPSYEAARISWEKTARGLQQRSTQLAERLGKLKEYLGPVTGQRRHRGYELARARVEREHPYLTKLYDAVIRERRDERIRAQEQERERNRGRQKEHGRDGREPGR